LNSLRWPPQVRLWPTASVTSIPLQGRYRGISCRTPPGRLIFPTSRGWRWSVPRSASSSWAIGGRATVLEAWQELPPPPATARHRDLEKIWLPSAPTRPRHLPLSRSRRPGPMASGPRSRPTSVRCAISPRYSVPPTSRPCAGTFCDRAVAGSCRGAAPVRGITPLMRPGGRGLQVTPRRFGAILEPLARIARPSTGLHRLWHRRG
jgi:hypothetical protein